jgi:hypothetical protein
VILQKEFGPGGIADRGRMKRKLSEKKLLLLGGLLRLLGGLLNGLLCFLRSHSHLLEIWLLMPHNAGSTVVNKTLPHGCNTVRALVTVHCLNPFV